MPKLSFPVVLGLDFGTLSGRALLVHALTGQELASVVVDYPHGCIDEFLPGSRRRKLPHEFALQNPQDYWHFMKRAVPAVFRQSGISPARLAGIGIDFTSCTILPTTATGEPLCQTRSFRSNPHAWVKLWKHHAAQPQADAINEAGLQGREEFLRTYGGKYSSEWFFSKVLETAQSAPDVYEAADRFLEAGDWIVWQLCGEEKRCLSAAGFKGMRVHPSNSGWTFPSPDFFKSLHPRLENVIDEKVGHSFYPLGARAGILTKQAARRLGLPEGIPIATANIDAHAAVPACGVTTPGKLVMIMGTSTCHLMVDAERREVEGMCGVVQDGVIPGYWGYEAGQSGVGDMFAWYVEKNLPAAIVKAAQKNRRSPYEELQSQAATLKAGESGLLALDWWNGNRSVLVDAHLSGVLVGVTLSTRPHHIYRAMLEATAFGTQKIIQAFTDRGIQIDELVACGGLARKNPLMMQIYADITERRIVVAGSDQASALGAAMHGAVAAGLYRTIQQAARKMAPAPTRVFRPNRSTAPVYRRLYQEYTRLHDWMGRDPKGTLKVLRAFRG